jgi:hypothetical protein
MLPTTFPDYVAGTWLIGWSGGYDHFSWVRLQGHDSGRADFLSVVSTRGGYTPYFGCNGQGTWAITQKPNTIYLYFPPGCSTQNVQQAYTFVSFVPGSGGPKGTVASASFEEPPTAQEIEGYQFPDSQCDAAFATCTDPLQ